MYSAAEQSRTYCRLNKCDLAEDEKKGQLENAIEAVKGQCGGDWRPAAYATIRVLEPIRCHICNNLIFLPVKHLEMSKTRRARAHEHTHNNTIHVD